MRWILIPLLVVAFAFPDNHWRYQWLLALNLLSLWLGLEIKKKVGLIPGLFFAVSAISCLFVFYNPVSEFGVHALRFDQAGGRAFASLLSVSLVAALMPAQRLSDILWAFEMLAVCNSAAMIINRLFITHLAYGLMSNPSDDGAFIALCYHRW